MNWLSELFGGDSAATAVLVISVVSVLGIALGSIRVFGITLGIGGVLFSGLLFGHFDISINEKMMEFIREFGLILFVYTIGMQVGPGFFSSLRHQGLTLNLLAGAIVLLGAAIAVSLRFVADVEPPVVAGLFAGASTNTPTLAAAQQVLKDGHAPLADIAKPALSYAITYPFGIIGTILTMLFIRTLFRVDPQKEAVQFIEERSRSASKLVVMNLDVTNPNLEGITVENVPLPAAGGVVISRVYHDGVVRLAQPDTPLHVGDVILTVGEQELLDKFQVIVGRQSATELLSLPSNITSRSVIVTKRKALGTEISRLRAVCNYGVTITRVTRAEIEFMAEPDLEIQFGDRLMAVGDDEAIDRLAAEVGDSEKQLNYPHLVPVLIGITLGVLVGSCPVHLPGIPAPLKLGLAGGPMLVAIILSRMSRIGPFVWYLPVSANLMLRELGIVLFLACVGLRNGEHFFEILVSGPGVKWMGYGVLITLIPLMTVALAARIFLKANFAALCGVLSGSMTDPPALAYAGHITASEAPYVSYATVYPLTVLMRVMLGQALVVLLPQVVQ